MRYIGLTLKTLPILLVFGLLHYVLPQHDVVKITSTEVIRTDFSGFNRLFYAQADSGNAEQPTRDLRLINTERKKTFLFGFVRREAEGIMVYRNEDTGWIWPPYFKFDSSDLQAEASASISAPAAEQWAVMTHYGWRNRLATIYPNAIGIRKIDGPDVTVVPWFNIFFFVFVIVAYIFARAFWRQLRQRKIDPLVENAGEAYDRISDHAEERRGRISRWLDTWRSKRRR